MKRMVTTRANVSSTLSARTPSKSYRRQPKKCSEEERRKSKTGGERAGLTQPKLCPRPLFQTTIAAIKARTTVRPVLKAAKVEEAATQLKPAHPTLSVASAAARKAEREPRVKVGRARC